MTTTAKISRYLTRDEYVCKCCHRLPPGLIENHDDGGYPECFESLFYVFDELRRQWGKPIAVNSGYRCPARNAVVGGGRMSAHMFGLALDMAITGDDVKRAVDLIRSIDRRIRIGYRKYNGALVHVDTAFYVWPRPVADFVEGLTW